jgi:iron transport multicopper oxidase
MQDTQNATFAVEAGKTYLIRFINIGGFVGTYVKLDHHKMTIVEIDGIYTVPQEVSELYITVAQRYSVLVTMKDSTDTNYAISATLDTTMFDHIPPWANPDVFGFLVYNPKKPLPTPKPLRTYRTIDDTKLLPRDQMKALDKVDHQIIMTMDFADEEGINRYIYTFLCQCIMLTILQSYNQQHNLHHSISTDIVHCNVCTKRGCHEPNHLRPSKPICSQA